MSESESQDVFAAIAARRVAYRSDQLITPAPPPRPTRRLPLAPATSTSAALPRARKITTEAALKRELGRWRKRFAPFMRRLAPHDPQTRDLLELTRFDWREETRADQRDGTYPLAGKGKWKTVHIPHYGEPLGRAVTYYRTTFRITKAMRERGALFVRFGAVDYKATVFINNTCVGTHEGFFSPFEFDVTEHAVTGKNVLMVRVENDAICGGNGSWGKKKGFFEGDKIYAATGLGYDEPDDGWHHCPPGMGICQAVTIEARPRLHVTDIFVRPDIDAGTAEAWIEVWNCDPVGHDVRVGLSLYGENFRETLFSRMKAGTHPAGPRVNYLRVPITIPNARTWTPDHPWLYRLRVTLSDTKGRRIDCASSTFGMRSFVMDTQTEPRGNFHLNGTPLRLRGTNTMGNLQQCVFHKQWDQLRDDILLARICNMNFFRLTQRPVQPEIYDYCNRLGMMAQTDLPLFGVLRRSQFCEAVRQAEEMERLIRAHPCSIMVSYINEPTDSAHLKTKRHLTRTELERFFRAASEAVLVQNPDRIIKPVDGDYDPPAPGLPDNHCYCAWYNGHGVDLGRLHRGYWQPVKPGWNYGCGEFGAEGLDYLDLMMRRYPKRWLPSSPTDDHQWTPKRIPKAQTGNMHYMWFETPDTPQDWVNRSQAHQAWATRLMTDAFRRDPRMVSIAIHLFVDAFPSGWMKTIMDVERRPKPAYFVYRDALAPIAVQLRTDRHNYFAGEHAELEAWVCNDTPRAVRAHTLCYEVRLPDGTRLTGATPATCGPVTSRVQGKLRFPIPEIKQRKRFRAALTILDEDGAAVHDATLELEAFPRSRPGARRSICVVGGDKGKAAQLCRDLGQALRTHRKGVPISEDIILVDDVQALSRSQAAVDDAVRAGAHAVLLEAPRTEAFALADATLTIRGTGMYPVHVASRKTGHPAVRGLKPDDFKFWYDPEAGYVTPLLDQVVKAEGWTPILLTGAGGFGVPWHSCLAAAEKAHGKGKWSFCQVRIAGRTRVEPVADRFARQLLGLM